MTEALVAASEIAGRFTQPETVMSLSIVSAKLGKLKELLSAVAKLADPVDRESAFTSVSKARATWEERRSLAAAERIGDPGARVKALIAVSSTLLEQRKMAEAGHAASAVSAIAEKLAVRAHLRGRPDLGVEGTREGRKGGGGLPSGEGGVRGGGQGGRHGLDPATRTYLGLQGASDLGRAEESIAAAEKIVNLGDRAAVLTSVSKELARVGRGGGLPGAVKEASAAADKGSKTRSTARMRLPRSPML